LAFVLQPVFFGVRRVPAPAVSDADPRNRGDSAIQALREIEFDRATGKLSEADYAQLKARYTREAVLALRRGENIEDEAAASSPTDDDVEAVIRAYRERRVDCPSCGPRPEPDAVFCSNCGRYLRDRCASCDAPVAALDARYCVSCGTRLAA